MNHFRVTKWGRVSGWQGNAASSLDDATTLVVEVNYGLTIQKFPFAGLGEVALREKFERALDLAFEDGEQHARAEIRKALGVTEPRR